MTQIGVKSDLEATVSQWARAMGEQMPCAAALALTRSAKEEVERQLPLQTYANQGSQT